LDLNDMSERLARLEAAAARRNPDAWPAALASPSMLTWTELEHQR
jgi:hypothetical protein